MSEQQPSQRLIIRPLGPVYRILGVIVEPMLRVTAGLLLVPHGAQKLFGWFDGAGLQGTAEAFAGMGFAPGWLFATAAGLLEFVGGLMLMLGVLTRPVALAVTAFMAVAVIGVHKPMGYFWTDGGYEYPMMWGILAFAFVIRGGGRFSIDRLIGREI